MKTMWKRECCYEAKSIPTRNKEQHVNLKILYLSIILFKYHVFRPVKDDDKLNAAEKELLNLLRRKSHADKV